MTPPFNVAAVEQRNSNLWLPAALLRDRGKQEEALSLFATAAEIEARHALEGDARPERSAYVPLQVRCGQRVGARRGF